MLKREFWTLNKAMVLGLISAFAFLLLEIRYEHRQVLQEEPAAWIPIVFSGASVLLGLLALGSWDRWGRQALMGAFALACVVGVLGVWFHTEGRPGAALAVVTASLPGTPVFAESEGSEAPATPEGRPNAGAGEKTPPYLAPLAFCGLGLFGLLACSRRLPAEYEGSSPHCLPSASEVAA
jgi:hypothetical protein